MMSPKPSALKSDSSGLVSLRLKTFGSWSETYSADQLVLESWTLKD